MTSLDETLSMLGTIIPPLGVEPVALDQGLGRVLRETVVAAEDQPPFARSAMDGFAVRLDDESSEFRAVDFLRAGDWRPRSLALGEAVRIATGAALPGDGLQIILIEDAEISGDRVRIPQRDAARHVRERGEDARRGDTLLAPPRRLSAGALALLASLGVPRLSVTRLPRIVHIATGNEIVAPGQTPLPGQIRDSNSTLVRAFLAARGLPVLQHRAPEDFATTRALLLDPAQGAPAADLLLISGGASVGGHDFTRRLLTELGCEILIARVASRPGKPLIVARRGAAVAFGLPGNPLAHFVCLHLFVQRALDTLAGLPGETPFQEGVLADALDHDSAGRETLWPACQSIVGGASALEPLRWSSSGDLTPLARANALIRVPGGVRGLARGARVPFVSTTPPS